MLGLYTPMDAKEKVIARFKLGLTLQKVISANTARAEKDGLITSLRKLAAASETEYAIIQKISAGKKDPQFTTLVAIADGFGLSLTELGKVYDSISENDIEEHKRTLKKQQQDKKVKEKISDGKKK